VAKSALSGRKRVGSRYDAHSHRKARSVLARPLAPGVARCVHVTANGTESVGHPETPAATRTPEARRHVPARAEKREQARRRVEKIALSAYKRHGFDGVTVEQICTEAQIAPATFYRYFGSKEGVIFRYAEGFLNIAREVGQSVDPELPSVEQMRYIVRRCAVFFEAQSEIRALRDEIVLANPGLVQRTFAIERRFESILADALASVRQESDPSTGTRLDAALCMVVARLALIAWRYEKEASLLTFTDDTFETLMSRLA
jgi:AcrR family transcriptional regulator